MPVEPPLALRGTTLIWSGARACIELIRCCCPRPAPVLLRRLGDPRGPASVPAPPGAMSPPDVTLVSAGSDPRLCREDMAGSDCIAVLIPGVFHLRLFRAADNSDWTTPTLSKEAAGRARTKRTVKALSD